VSSVSDMTKPPQQRSEDETARREDATLNRLLAMPPQPKTKKNANVSPPKRRGRPKKGNDDSDRTGVEAKGHHGPSPAKDAE